MVASIQAIRGTVIVLVILCLAITAVFYFRNTIAWDEYRLIVVTPNPYNVILIPAEVTSIQPDDVRNHTLTNTDHTPVETSSVFNDELKKFFLVQPNTDKSPLRSEVEQVQRLKPNLPIVFWNDNKNKKMFYKNSSCAKFPNIFDLHYNNRNWQTLDTTNGTFQLYGAYYETRELSEIKPAVRILGVLNRIEPTVKTHCQLWFSSFSEPVIVEVWEYHFVWYKEWGRYKQGLYQPYLIACKMPTQFQKEVPVSVSLVEKPCDLASNHLRVIYDKPSEKKDFAVCVKGLDFPYVDLSVRIIEWIEVLGALGVDKIFFYEFDVHPNTTKVLNYYQELGRIEVIPHSLPAEKPNLPGLQHMYLSIRTPIKNQLEIIPYNDCFYKHMYAYRYIVLLDIDEVIMPGKVTSWKELMVIVEAKALAENEDPRSYFSARNVYFFDSYPEEYGWFENIPKYMHMLQHVYRTKNFTKPGYYVKSFFNAEKALGINNHFPFTCLSTCNQYSILEDDAKLQHYRADCVPELRNVCGEFRNNVQNDTSIWKIKDEVIKGTINTMKNVGFFNIKK